MPTLLKAWSLDVLAFCLDVMRIFIPTYCLFDIRVCLPHNILLLSVLDLYRSVTIHFTYEP